MPRRAASVGPRGNPREFGKDRLARARLLSPEQQAEQCRDAGAFEARKADDFSGTGREVDFLQRAATQSPDRDGCRLAIGSPGQRRRKQGRLRRADHPLDHLRYGQIRPFFRQHVAAVAGDRDPVADREDFLEPVRDIEHRDAAAIELPQDIEKPLRFALVERGVRLIEDQETRLFQQHARQFDKLLLADAEAADRQMDVEMQAEPIQEISAAFLHGADRDEAPTQWLPVDEQVRQHRPLREETQFLVDDADAVLARHDRRTDHGRDAVEFYLAGVRANHARERFHERRFARAVFAHDSMNVTAADGEVHVVDSDDPSVALAEAANSDERRCRPCWIQADRAAVKPQVRVTGPRRRSAPSSRSSCRRQGRSRISSTVRRRPPSPSGPQPLSEAEER